MVGSNDIDTRAADILHKHIAECDRCADTGGVNRLHAVEYFVLWQSARTLAGHHSVFAALNPYGRGEASLRVCSFVYGVGLSLGAGVAVTEVTSPLSFSSTVISQPMGQVTHIIFLVISSHLHRNLYNAVF